MKRLVYSSATKMSPAKKAKLDKLRQEVRIKNKMQEIAEKQAELVTLQKELEILKKELDKMS